jgi:phospho-N-acetylmuramoyl-pentapeptide-transferase
MLYYIFRLLEQYDIPGSHLWSYISFRSLLTLILSLLISMLVGEWFIKFMKRRKIYEVQRKGDDDPFAADKGKTPTMGGIIIIVSILVPVLLFGRLRNIYLILMIATTLWLGLLGFLDDYIKLTKGKEGLKGKWKIVGQLSIGFIVGLVLWLSPDAVVRENVNVVQQQNQEVVVKHKSEAVKSLQTTIPFVKNHNLDYSKVASYIPFVPQSWYVPIGWMIFVLMTILVVMAISNGANLNDGLDGMCAGNSAIIGAALGILAYVSSHVGFASYFDIMYIPHSEELVVFLCAFIGATVGFLWYNASPAQVFMGDTGSLAIGGIIGVCAVIIHKELLMPILCGIFLVESLSVIIQTQWFKLMKRKGKRVRVFRATPIHDSMRKRDADLDATSTYLLKKWPKLPRRWKTVKPHMTGEITVTYNKDSGKPQEKIVCDTVEYWHEGYEEQKITLRFWIITIILAAMTIITLKIR